MEQSKQDIDKSLNTAIYQASQDVFRRIGYNPNVECKKEQVEIAMVFCQILNDKNYGGNHE
jgi:hypothetical protein